MSANSDYLCTLEPKYVKKAKDELFEVPEDRLSAVQAFRDWIQQQPHITCPKQDLDTMFLLTFLRWAKWSQIRARERLESFLSMKLSLPKVYKDIDTTENTTMTILKSGMMLAPHTRTPKGEQVLIIRLGIMGLPYKMHDFVRIMSMVMMQGFFNEMTQVNGVCFVVDYAGLNAKILKKIMSPESAEILKSFMNKIPVRWKSVKYYRPGILLETMMTFVNRFKPKKLQERTSSHETMETIYPDIPMECLPMEYLPDDYHGPNADTIEELTEQLIADLTEPTFRAKIKFLTSDAYSIDESKRPTEHITSHFRKLNVE